jgi:PAS domain S-box-containing protein
MPHFNGIEVLEMARERDEFTQVIIITGQGSEEDAADAVRKNAFDYLKKPVDKDILLNKLKQAIEHKDGILAKKKYELELESKVNQRTNELEKSKQKYKTIIANMLDGFYQTDRDEIITSCNAFFADIFGYKKYELIGKNVRETLYHNFSDRGKLLKELEKNGFVKEMDLVLKHKDGSDVIIEVNSHKMYNEKEEYIGIEGLVHNITRRKKLENELTLQKAVYANLFDNLAEGVYQTDAVGNITICNNNFASIFGYTKEDLIGRNVNVLYFDPADRVKLLNELKINHRVKNYILRLKRKNGKPVLVSVNTGFVVYDPNKTFYIEGSLRDVTKELTDAQISQLSHKLSSDAVYIVGFDQKFKYINEAVCNLSGFSAKEILGNHINCLLHPYDAEQVVQELTKKEIDSKYESHYHFRCVRKDRKIIWVEVDSKYCEYLGERGVIGFARNITRRVDEKKKIKDNKKKLEKIVRMRTQEIIRQRDNYNAILDGLEEPVNIISTDFTVRYQNKKSKDLFGDGIGDKCYDVFQCERKGTEVCSLYQIIKKKIYIYDRAYKNGTTFRYQSSRFVDVDDKDAMLEIGVDLTENLEKDRKLFQAERLVTVGRLAAEMAHELKQPLVVIGMAVPNIRRLLGSFEGKEKEKISQKLNEINRQVGRVGKIIDHVRGFSQDKDLVVIPVDLQKVAKDALIFFEEQFKIHKIDLVQRWHDNLPMVKASGEYIEQVIVNILNNAHDALESQYRNNPTKKRVIVSTYYNSQNSVAGIKIFNNGVPVPESMVNKIFEPFVSTKKDGLGIGLARAKEIVEGYGGRINFSDNTRGTTFRVELPVVKGGGYKDVKRKNINS